MFNEIVSDKLQCLEPFNCVQTNVYCWIELLALNNNIFNYLTIGLNWNIYIT